MIVAAKHLYFLGSGGGFQWKIQKYSYIHTTLALPAYNGAERTFCNPKIQKPKLDTYC